MTHNRRYRSGGNSRKGAEVISSGCGTQFDPTLADLCGLSQVPGNLQGKSLRPLLDNPAAAWVRPAVSQVSRNRGGRADSVMGYTMRTERYRYTEWNDGAEGAELYDYQADPKEMQNMAKSDRHAKVKAELSARLHTITKARGKT